MDCPICRDLKRVFETRLSQYLEARSSVIHRFSTKFAAYKNVEMQRAKNELEEHQLVCISTDEVVAFMPQREMSVSLRQLAA
jgi:hypothetical protein